MAIVSAAEFQRNLGRYQDKAQSEPVTITKHGRESLVLVSAEEYRRLKRRDRKAFSIEEVSDETLAAIEKAKVPDEYAYLDAELKDWTP
jgi:prevent-host-death family protein